MHTKLIKMTVCFPSSNFWWQWFNSWCASIIFKLRLCWIWQVCSISLHFKIRSILWVEGTFYRLRIFLLFGTVQQQQEFGCNKPFPTMRLFYDELSKSCTFLSSVLCGHSCVTCMLKESIFNLSYWVAVIFLNFLNTTSRTVFI